MVSLPTFYVCKLGYNDGNPVILTEESEVCNDYNLFKDKILAITHEYEVINAVVWRSALNRLCLDNSIISSYTWAHHLHICFELKKSRNDHTLFVTFEKQMQHITFSYSESDNLVNQWVCWQENGQWNVGKRSSVAQDSLTQELSIIPVTMGLVMETPVWTENLSVSVDQQIISTVSHSFRRLFRRDIGVEDCFQRQYNLLNCNCQVFIHQFVTRLGRHSSTTRN